MSDEQRAAFGAYYGDGYTHELGYIEPFDIWEAVIATKEQEVVDMHDRVVLERYRRICAEADCAEALKWLKLCKRQLEEYESDKHLWHTSQAAESAALERAAEVAEGWEFRGTDAISGWVVDGQKKGIAAAIRKLKA